MLQCTKLSRASTSAFTWNECLLTCCRFIQTLELSFWKKSNAYFLQVAKHKGKTNDDFRIAHFHDASFPPQSRTRSYFWRCMEPGNSRSPSVSLPLQAVRLQGCKTKVSVKLSPQNYMMRLKEIGTTDLLFVDDYFSPRLGKDVNLQVTGDHSLLAASQYSPPVFSKSKWLEEWVEGNERGPCKGG